MKSRPSQGFAGLLIPLLAVAVLSCGDNREASLYRVERDLWRAARLERALQIGPESPPTPEETGRVLEAYRTLLAESPQSSEATRAIARLRAEAQLGIVRMHRMRGEKKDARRVLEEGCDEYLEEANLALRFFLELIDQLRNDGEERAAVRLYQKLPTVLPARTEEGMPLTPVQDAPIRAADLLLELGLEEEAAAELERAEAYYRAIIDENPTDQAAAFAWVQLATVAARRGAYDRAAESLERAREIAAPGVLENRILFILGILQQEGRRDLEAAVSVFTQLLDAEGEAAFASETMVRLAGCLADLGRYEEAVATLDRMQKEFPRDVAGRARAELLAARILTQAERWPEALTRYHMLQANHPTSPEAMGAPLEIAAHYGSIGEPEAARRVLQRALEEYEALRKEYSGTPIARMADEGAAQALGELERWSEAANLLLQLPASYPDDPRNILAIIEAARIFEQRLGRPERAAELLEELAATCPDSALSVRAQEEASRLRRR